MIATTAAKLLPDAALPQRDRLLDRAVIADRLAAALDLEGLSPGRCERIRVNYQIGKSLRTVHRLHLADRSVVVAARAFRLGRSEAAYREALAAAVPRDSWPAVVHDADLETVFWTFPNDRKIAALPHVASRPALLACEGAHAYVHTRLAAYAPEKSATLALVDAQGEVAAYAKVCAREQGRQDHDLCQRLWRAVPPGHPNLAVPRPIGYDPSRRTLVLSAVKGRRLADLTHAAAVPDVFRLGSALASFHRLDVEAPSAFVRFQDEPLRKAANLLASMRPDAGDAAAALAEKLIARSPAENPAGFRLLHGDVHPKNAIVTDTSVTLIDVEDAVTGPPAADVASFLAGLHYLTVAGRLSRAARLELSEAFQAGYDGARPGPPLASLQWHTAAALLVERAARAVTRLRPLGLEYLGPLLTHAARVLDGLDDA